MEQDEMDHKLKKSFLWGLLSGALGVLAAGVIWFFVAQPLIIPVNVRSDEGMSYEQMWSFLQKANGIIDHLQKEYILEDLDNADLIEGMYKGMLDVLDDKYAAYYTKEEYDELRKQTDGSYGGIGMTMTQDNEIVGVYPDSPAEKAGIQIGDILTHVEGESVEGMSRDQLREKIGGKLGDTKRLTLYRPSEERSYEAEVTLAEVETPTVFWHELEDGIVYLQITAFDRVTQKQFEEAWNEISQDGKMKGLILDLRDNLGGSLDTVLKVADALLPEGLITYTEDKQGSRQEYYAKGEGCKVPIALLVNGYSASASELLCGALKDHGAATVVGTTTYGKGIVQTTWSLADGTAFKMTTAKYYTPNGNNIQGSGIEPDIEIDLTEEQKAMEELPEDEDIQLQTALEAIRTALGR